MINYRKMPQGVEEAFCKLLSDFVRRNKLKLVVETGVCHGVSSFCLLDSVPDNGCVISIEPSVRNLKELIVPPSYYPKWILVHGKSQDVLNNVFKLVGKIDLFLHDSCHRYEVMMFEYRLARKYARFIASHDINHSGAGTVWEDFKAESNLEILTKANKWVIARNLDVD